MKKSFSAALLAALIIVLTTTATYAQKTTTKSSDTKRTRVNQHQTRYLNVESDSIGDPVKRIKTDRDGHIYKIKLYNDKITELSIDGSEVASQDFSKYQSMVDEILAEVKRDQEQAERDRQQADVDRRQADKDRLQADADRRQADKDRASADMDRQQAERDREQAGKDRQQADKDKQQAEKDRANAEMDRQQAERDRAQAGKDRQQAERDRAQAEIDRKQAEEDRKLVAALVADLVTDNIIANEDSLHSMELSDSGMTINKKPQPESVFQKYKAKYLKKPGMKFGFYNEGHNRTIQVNNK